MKVARRRRDSASKAGAKQALDIDDIFTILMYLDESKQLDRISLFVADNSDKMPSGLINLQKEIYQL